MAAPKQVVAIGELVWDLFPDREVLGGFPVNLGYGLSCLGRSCRPVTAVGADERGKRAVEQVADLGLSTAFVQTSGLPTGTVDISLDAAGEPTFTIRDDVAWDDLQWEPDLKKLARETEAVCFSTLGQRAPASKETIQTFLEAAPDRALRVFDINLRRPHYSAGLIRDSLRQADVLKLSDPELETVTELLDLDPGPVEGRMARLRDQYELRLVCLTRAERGSLLMDEREIREHPGRKVEVADAVGAGDAFLAALVYYYLRNAPLDTISEAANRLGAWVASQSGATPDGMASAARRIRHEIE